MKEPRESAAKHFCRSVQENDHYGPEPATPSPPRVTLSETPSHADFFALLSAVDGETAQIAGPMELRHFALLLHDNAGSVIGGLWGHTAYSWLTIDLLFIPPAMRTRGIGSVLVRWAEAIARERDCFGAYVAAFDFQAPRFYQRLGYTVFAVHEGLPLHHNHLHFRKHL
jgi:GNAT superfamily N-acetyltransferase